MRERFGFLSPHPVYFHLSLLHAAARDVCCILCVAPVPCCALVVEYNASRMLLVVHWPLLTAHEMRQCRVFAVATRMCKHAARVLLHVVCCLLHVVCYLLSVAFCTLLVGCYSLRDVCCMLHVARCMLHAICCLLLRPLHNACCHNAA